MLLIHPEDRQNAAHEIQKLAMGQETLELEIRCRAKDGVYRWIRWTSAAGPGDTFFIATGRDATPIRETDSKLARLSIVLDNSEDAIVSKSLDDKIGTWNRAAEDLFRYSAEEIIGRDASVLVPTEQMGEETMMLAKLRAGLYVGPTETVRRRKDGSTVNVLLTMSLIRDRQHHACGVSLIFRETHREDEPHQPATPALVGAH
jgi:PAS domain S-box-containing protein